MFFTAMTSGMFGLKKYEEKKGGERKEGEKINLE